MPARLRYLLPFALAASALAQKPADTPTPTISAQARLVNLPVVVRDNKGKLVQNLAQTDFVLTVDSQPATIRYFDKDTNVPLTLGLLIDTSGSLRTKLDEERKASGVFLEQMLGKSNPDGPDRAFVLQFARSSELLQDLTDSKPKLQAALKEIDSQTAGQDPDPTPDNNSGGGRRGGGGSSHGGTVLYDAVYLSGDELMSKQHGRKAVIILSDGDDRGSRKSLAKAIEAAQRADTIIYAIYFKGEDHGGGGRGFGFPGGGPGGGGGGRHGGGGSGDPGGGQRGGGEDRVDGKKVLQRMADETGGRLFEVKGKQDVAAIYTEIAEELHSQYRLGYTPTEATAAEGYHQLTLTIPTQKKVLVQTRDGYYTGAK